jgi:pimeloyl-ACP methyl ester carboxylesterase
MASQPSFVYLHGLASGPNSTKAAFLQKQFERLKVPLLVPDLNQNDFYHLTLTRQLEQVVSLFPPGNQPVILIGSSLGGLTAAWLGEHCAQVQRLLLLAPAFEFQQVWLPQLQNQLQTWQTEGSLAVYHYTAQRSLPLSYAFVEDLSRYHEADLQRPVPTLILHGRQDQVIPISVSRRYAESRPWVRLQEHDSDHGMAVLCQPIWSILQSWLAELGLLADE